MNALYSKLLKKYGVRPQRGAGYFYWLDAAGVPVTDSESVMVCALSHLPEDRWESLAKDAAELLPKSDYAKYAPQSDPTKKLVASLRGCADALREAGRDFALANPHASRPNLYELHEASARAVLAEVGGVL